MTRQLIATISAAALAAVSHPSAAAPKALERAQIEPGNPFPADTAVQRILDDYIAAKRCEGIVLATHVPGRTQFFTAGTTGRPHLSLDGDTLFEIGSITKTLTASLLAEMVRRGEVKLDDPVSMHLPAGVRVPERGGRQITLVDLVTHTSGLPGLPSNIQPGDMANPYSDYSMEMLDAFLADHELTRDIASRYEYSAVGMGLLGRALGHRLGMTWEEALEQRILRPLGMHSTHATLAPELRGRLAQGHDQAGKPAPPWDIPALPAMGALKSSANDLVKFLAANMETRSKPFGAIFAQMHEPRAVMDEETRVGLAWQIGHATNRTMIWHGGGTGGSRALIAFEPEKQMGIVVLCNSAGGADDIGFHLLDPSLPV